MQKHKESKNKAKKQFRTGAKETRAKTKKEVSFATDVILERAKAVRQQRVVEARRALATVLRFKHKVKGTATREEQQEAQAALAQVIRFRTKDQEEAMRRYKEKMQEANNKPAERLKRKQEAQAAYERELQSMVQHGQELRKCLLCESSLVAMKATTADTKKLFCDHCYTRCRDACTALRLHYLHSTRQPAAPTASTN